MRRRPRSFHSLGAAQGLSVAQSPWGPGYTRDEQTSYVITAAILGGGGGSLFHFPEKGRRPPGQGHTSGRRWSEGGRPQLWMPEFAPREASSECEEIQGGWKAGNSGLTIQLSQSRLSITQRFPGTSVGRGKKKKKRRLLELAKPKTNWQTLKNK